MKRILFAVVTAAMFSMTPLASASASTDVYDKIRPSVAWVITGTPTPGKIGLGTAWVVDQKQRLLITNNHVIDNSRGIKLYFPQYQGGKLVTDAKWYLKNGTGYRAVVVVADPARDLAVIRVSQLPAGAKELKLSVFGVRAGEEVFTVGNPTPETRPLWTPNQSKVQKVEPRFRPTAAPTFAATAQRSGLRIGQGASGSPVVNAAGEIVGVIFFGTIDKKTGIAVRAWSIDVTEVRVVLAAARKQTNRPSLGIYLPSAQDRVDTISR